jgi:5'-3' exonuclease
MNSDTLLAIDTGALCYRGLLSFGKDTGPKQMEHYALFGFMSGVVELTMKFRPCRFAFCFDHGRNKRLDVFPAYKEAREKKAQVDPDYRNRRKAVHGALERLKTMLPAAGYPNVVYQDGYETDDVLAAVCLGSKKAFTDIVIVSEDQDFYQLLGHPVKIWKPRNRCFFTTRDFRVRYGIKAEDWPKVKAIGGCRGDGVPGIKGVSEETAVKYLKGEAHPQYAKRILANMDQARFCRKLVQLPYEGCDPFDPATLRKDCVTKDSWRDVCKANGLDFLAKQAPVYDKPRMGV